MSDLTLTPDQIADEIEARSKVIDLRMQEIETRASADQTSGAARLELILASVVETPLEKRLAAHGIKHPVFTIQAAKQVGIPLAYACADLMMETSGGLNEFGHDPGAWTGMYADRGFVTKPLYEEYRKLVSEGRSGLQGVGPCQLTSNTLQEEADKLGGCYVIVHNAHIGFLFLHQLQKEFGVQAGFEHYNGAGPAAVAYAQRAMVYVRDFEAIIG